VKKNYAWVIIGLVVVVVAFSLTISNGCGSSGSSSSSDCAAPAQDATGTWCVTISNSNSTCGNSNAVPYAAVYTQSGSNLSVTSQGGTYAGTVCGNMATITGTNFGFTTTTNATFVDANHATGTTTYSNATCSGTDTTTAVKGACP
jgi:hypothetical protein